MRNVARIVSLFGLLLLSACGVGKYAAAGDASWSTGYREMPIDASTWRVVYNGDAGSSQELVDRYALYRSAELTVEKGFDYFIVLDQQLDSQSKTSVSSSPGSTDVEMTHKVDPTTGELVPVAVATTRTKVTSTTTTTHSATKMIRMYKGTRPDSNANAFDAKSMVTVMAPYIER